ncbi:hypothetical protein Tco_0877791 [Tanacetum coccineum]|uniref:Uncharacterized protein n=1 Tax=Tanacetum coccineum TaxID=301880 RepID=A0ABQ5BW61_9ASTR
MLILVDPVICLFELQDLQNCSFLSTCIKVKITVVWFVSSGWSFVSTILGQMTYSVASLTLDSAGSYVMQGAPFTQGMIPSISIDGSISSYCFFPLFCYWCYSFVLIFGFLHRRFLLYYVGSINLWAMWCASPKFVASNSAVQYNGRSNIALQYFWVNPTYDEDFHKVFLQLFGVPVGPVFLLGLLALAIAAACASRAVAMPLAISCWMAAKVMAASRGYGMIHNDEDGDNDANDGDDDEREISWK